MSEDKASELNQQLLKAIIDGKPGDLKKAIAAGADVTGAVMEWAPTENDDNTSYAYKVAPLLMAVRYQSTEVMTILIEAVIQRSKMFRQENLPPEGAQQALDRNLYTLSSHDSQSGIREHVLERAAMNPAPHMLATVWPYFKGATDINRPFDEGRKLLHAAAGVPENLLYLLKEGADINATDERGITPLMEVCRMTKSKFSAWGTLALFEKYHADFHAVDNKGRNIIFHAFKAVKKGVLPNAQLECIRGALDRGVNALAKDKFGKTALDYFVEQRPVLLTNDLDNSDIFSVMITLVEYGYGVSTLARGKDIRSGLTVDHRFTHFMDIANKEIASADVLEKLWNADGSPSKLLISACGYEVLDTLFAQPTLKQNPTRARELYQEMVQKLPSHCQEYLRTGIDLSFLRDAISPPRSAAVSEALKRKSDTGKLPGGERQPGK